MTKLPIESWTSTVKSWSLSYQHNRLIIGYCVITYMKFLKFLFIFRNHIHKNCKKQVVLTSSKILLKDLIFRNAASTQTLVVKIPHRYLWWILTVIVNTPLLQSTSLPEHFSVDVLISIYTHSIKSLKNKFISINFFSAGKSITYSIKTYIINKVKGADAKLLFPLFQFFSNLLDNAKFLGVYPHHLLW